MIPVGFWGVGSMTIDARVGQVVQKGDYIGHFNYGGSSIVLAFEPGHDISFTVDNLALSTTGNYPRLANVRGHLGKVVPRPTS
eukprot:gene13638-19520_t